MIEWESNNKKKYDEERAAVAYIAIDNVEDILQYVHEKYADAVDKIEDKLKAWADSMNGILKSYDNDKYILFFDSVYLKDCVKNRFEILTLIKDSEHFGNELAKNIFSLIDLGEIDSESISNSSSLSQSNSKSYPK